MYSFSTLNRLLNEGETRDANFLISHVAPLRN